MPIRLLLPFIIVVLGLSFNARGQDVAVNIQQTECAIEGDKIIPGDGTLCSNDIAFGMIYEMFPSIINEILPLWSLDDFAEMDENNKPSLLGEYHGDKVFITLFNLFYKLVFYCVAIYVALMLASIGMRWLRGEPIAENQSAKDSPRSMFSGALVGGSFMLPYKNFFVGQVVVFSLGISALALANFVYSLFLAGNQQIFDMDSPIPASEMAPPSIAVQERHDFLSDSFYRYLTRMQLCRMQSTENILSGEGGRFTSVVDYNKGYMCASGGGMNDQSVISLNAGGDNVSPFVWLKRTHSEDGHGRSILYGDVEKIIFSTSNSGVDSCQIDGEALPDFGCGGIHINRIDWASNPLFRLLTMQNEQELLMRVGNLQSQLSPNMPASTVSAVVSSHWQELKSALEDALVTEWGKVQGESDGGGVIAVNNEAVLRASVLKDALMGNAREHFQEASQMFHRAAMNAIMFGQGLSYKKISESGAAMPEVFGTSQWEAISYRMDKAAAFAKLVAQAQCRDYSYHHNEAELSAKFLRGEIDSLPGQSHAKCLDVLSKSVLEYSEATANLTGEALRASAVSRIDAISAELKTAWTEETTQFAGQRRAIEKSFSDSVNDERSSKWWINLRQKGYLSVGDYALTINERVSGYKRDVKQLVNNYSLSDPDHDDAYVSHALQGEYEQSDVFYSFDMAGNQVFGNTRLPDGNMDSFIDNSLWIAEQEALLRERKMGLDSETFLSSFQIDTGYLDRLGLGLKQGDKDSEECLQDPSKCPFPLSDPIIELSLMGHDMVDVAITFYSVAVPIKFIVSPTAERIRGGFSGKGGSVGGKKNGMMSALAEGSAGIGGKAGGLLKGVFKLVDSVATPVAVVMDMLYDALSTIMLFMLTFGLLLAYLLPLLPKIFLFMKFISWLMVLVMSSFSVLLWTLFWVRFKEKRSLLKEAGLHYGIELLLSPTFALISVIFAWYFFYVVAFGVGTGLSWVWQLPLNQGGGWLRSYFDTLVVIVLISTVYFIGLRYAYQLMSDLTGELLKKLGVADAKQKDRLGEIIKVILYDRVLEAAQSGNEKMSQKTGVDATRAHLDERAQKAQGEQDAYQAGFDSAMKGKERG